ncbi:MAG: IS1595 family transposase [Candidatus Cybelea sp.]
MDKTPATLLEAITYFADPDRAHAFAVKLRWPNGIACPKRGCGNADVQAIASRKTWRCKECKWEFSAKVGTIFESSPIGFTKWLPAMWFLANTKNGTSSHELGRALGVTQKTAWFMLHRIREAMAPTETRMFDGVVEADETFVGGRRKATMRTELGFKKMKHGPTEGKTTVFGIAERNGRGKSRVRAMVVSSRKRSELEPHIRQNVFPVSTIYTDALRSYRGLRDYQHAFVDHFVTYCEGVVHTNTIENFWSCLKRTLHGTYIAPRAFHLDAYVDEQVFRFNEREGNDSDRFLSVMRNTDGKRLMYKTLRCSNPSLRIGQRGPIHRPLPQ